MHPGVGSDERWLDQLVLGNKHNVGLIYPANLNNLGHRWNYYLSECIKRLWGYRYRGFQHHHLQSMNNMENPTICSP